MWDSFEKSFLKNPGLRSLYKNHNGKSLFKVGKWHWAALAQNANSEPGVFLWYSHAPFSEPLSFLTNSNTHTSNL